MKAITLSPQDFAVFTSDKLIKVLQVVHHTAKELVTVIFDRVKPRAQKTTEFEISLEVHQSFEVTLPHFCKDEDGLIQQILDMAGYEVVDGHELDGGDFDSHVYESFQNHVGQRVAIISTIYTQTLNHECATLKQAKAYGNKVVKLIDTTLEAEYLAYTIKPLKRVNKVLAG